MLKKKTTVPCEPVVCGPDEGHRLHHGRVDQMRCTSRGCMPRPAATCQGGGMGKRTPLLQGITGQIVVAAAPHHERSVVARATHMSLGTLADALICPASPDSAHR